MSNSIVKVFYLNVILVMIMLYPTAIAMAQCVGEISVIAGVPTNIGCKYGSGGPLQWDGPSGGDIINDNAVKWTKTGTFRLTRDFHQDCQGTPLYSPYYTIVSQPSAPTGLTQQVGCGQATLTYSGSEYNTFWQSFPDGTDETHRTTMTVTASKTYYARSKGANGCWSASTPISVTLPTLPVGGSLTRGGTFSVAIKRDLYLVGENGNIKEYRYKENGGSEVVVANTSHTLSASFVNTTNSSRSRAYWAVIERDGCLVNSSPTTITLTPQPEPTATLCAGEQQTFTVSTSTYGCSNITAGDVMVVSKSGIGDIAPNEVKAPTTPGIYTFKRVLSEPCYNSYEIVGVTIQIIGKPSTPPAPVIISDCKEVILGYNGTPSVGEEWHWQSQSSNGYNLNNASFYNVSVTDAYYLRARTSGGSCWGPPGPSIAVELKNFDYLTTPAIDSKCSADGLSLSLTSDNASDRWFSSYTSSVPLSQTNTLVIPKNPTTLYVQRNTGACTFRMPYPIDFTFDIKCGAYVNSVKRIKPLEPVGSVSASTLQEKSISYFDGLGRAMEEVSVKKSPLQKDMVTPITFDENGREPVKYLPYVVNSSDGTLQINPVGTPDTYISSPHYTFFTQSDAAIALDTKPYSVTIFEPSPLDRILKQGAPGQDWQPNDSPTADRSVKKSYDLNEQSEVLLLTYSAQTGTISLQGTYNTDQLYANKIQDEHDNEVIEYVNKEKKTVCRKVQYSVENGVKQYASTYYIYDDFGNLVMVLPPEAVQSIIAGTY